MREVKRPRRDAADGLSFRHYAELLDDIIYQSEFRAEKDISSPTTSATPEPPKV